MHSQHSFSQSMACRLKVWHGNRYKQALERLNCRPVTIDSIPSVRYWTSYTTQNAQNQIIWTVFFCLFILVEANRKNNNQSNDIIRNNNVHNTQIELFRLIDFAIYLARVALKTIPAALLKFRFKFPKLFSIRVFRAWHNVFLVFFFILLENSF